MEVHTHIIGDQNYAEIKTQQLLFNSMNEAIDLLGNMYYQGFEGMFVYSENLPVSFFDLKTKIAGEILQKFSNYRMKLAIIGLFNVEKSTSLSDFIVESNQTKQVIFAESLEKAIEMWK